MRISDSERRDVTARLSEIVERRLRRESAIVAREVRVDEAHRVDFVAFSPGPGGRNCSLEHGRFVFVEVKSCMDDFRSGHGLTFRGDENWLVCTRGLARELYDKRLLPRGVRVYCPNAADALCLAYDLTVHGTSMRDDSTPCLLWAMLTGSDSVMRSTAGLFTDGMASGDE